MYKPCTNAQFEIVPRWLHGCCDLLTTLQPRGNLVTTLCQGASKLGRLSLPSHGLVTSLAFLYGTARFLAKCPQVDLVYQTVFLARGEDQLGTRLRFHKVYKILARSNKILSNNLIKIVLSSGSLSRKARIYMKKGCALRLLETYHLCKNSSYLCKGLWIEN